MELLRYLCALNKMWTRLWLGKLLIKRLFKFWTDASLGHSINHIGIVVLEPQPKISPQLVIFRVGRRKIAQH